MAKQRKGPPPPPKKQKGSIFPVNEQGIRPQDYSTYTFNKQYAIPGLEALTEMYGDPGLGFLAGLLGTVGANIDNQLIPPTKAKQKGKSGKLTKAPDIAAAPDRGQSSSPPPESSAPRPGDYVPVPPRQSTPPRNAPNTDEELRDMLQQQSYRRATPAPEQSNFLNKLMQSLNNERAAQQQLSPLRSNLRYFVNPGNVPRAEYGGVPKYQNGQTATDGAQPKCPDGYQFDGKECVVITPGSATKQTPATHICPERYKWDEAQQKCVPFGMADNAKWAYTNINQIGQGMPGLGLVGQAGMNMAQAPGFKPDVGLGTMSGAMQGFAQGGILGAVGGGLMGFLSTGRDLDAYNTEADRFQRARVQNANVPPNLGYYAQYGGETPGAVPSQTETGEIVLFPDNTLPEVKASLRHSQMGDEEVTDMLPENSYVFSDDKDMKFDLKAMKDKVLGYGMSYYDEHSNYPTETMRFGDIMPESGKMTFAAAARILRSEVPTVGNKKDIFDIVTDADNLETRVPYIMELINLQDTKNASEGRTESTMGPQSEQPMGGPGEMPMMQAWGGMVPKYQPGGRNQDIRQSAYIRPSHPMYIQPTRQDSLALLNNSRLVDRYFKNTGNYKPYVMSDVDRDYQRRNPNSLNALLNNNSSGWGILSQLKESRRIYNPNDDRKYLTAGGGTNIGPLPMQYFYKEHPSNPFAFFQREGMNRVLDTRAPMQLFDRRIAPNKSRRYININASDPLQSDMIQLYEYDPVAIMPIDMMLRNAPHLIEQRRRQYGLTPGDLQYLNNSGYKAPGAAITQTPQVETPATPAEKEKVYQHWKHVNGVKIPITQEEYERDFGKAQEISRTPKIDSTKYDIVPYVKQFGGMGSILPTLMEKTYDKSIGSKFLGDKGKALIPIVTTALGVPAIRYGKKWTIIED